MDMVAKRLSKDTCNIGEPVSEELISRVNKTANDGQREHDALDTYFGISKACQNDIHALFGDQNSYTSML
jgi:hypothetical protein